VGIAEGVLAQHVDPTVPAGAEGLAAALAGEPPGQAVAGVDVGSTVEGWVPRRMIRWCRVCVPANLAKSCGLRRPSGRQSTTPAEPSAQRAK